MTTPDIEQDTEQDTRWMQRALELAQRGIFSTAPNPRVGCILVKGGEAVGEGWHVRAGEPHAEAHALQAAGEKARGATAYVSLEPCAHQGRTPPCADALIAAGIARAVVACRDPNPLVAGQGIARLQAAGIAVTEGVCEEEAQRLNRGFFRRITTGRPFVTLKLAASLDGKTALANGESQWLTGEAARADVHYHRLAADAIIADPARRLAGGRVPLPALLDELGARGINNAFVEAGASLAGAFIQQNLADEILLYLAPCLLGSGARELLQLPPLQHLSDKIRVHIDDSTRIGADLRLRLTPEKPCSQAS